VIKSPDHMEGESAESPGEITSSALSEEKQESVNALAGLSSDVGRLRLLRVARTN